MRVIKPGRIHEFGTEYPDAKPMLQRWLELASCAYWKSWTDVRKTFRDADQVTVESGRKVVVFNIRGNHYRLIVAIHYNMRKVFVLRFLTHADYNKNKWKGEL